jgi:hypothetical protein
VSATDKASNGPSTRTIGTWSGGLALPASSTCVATVARERSALGSFARSSTGPRFGFARAGPRNHRRARQLVVGAAVAITATAPSLNESRFTTRPASGLSVLVVST